MNYLLSRMRNYSNSNSDDYSSSDESTPEDTTQALERELRYRPRNLNTSNRQLPRRLNVTKVGTDGSAHRHVVDTNSEFFSIHGKTKPRASNDEVQKNFEQMLEAKIKEEIGGSMYAEIKQKIMESMQNLVQNTGENTTRIMKEAVEDLKESVRNDIMEELKPKQKVEWIPYVNSKDYLTSDSQTILQEGGYYLRVGVAGKVDDIVVYPFGDDNIEVKNEKVMVNVYDFKGQNVGKIEGIVEDNKIKIKNWGWQLPILLECELQG